MRSNGRPSAFPVPVRVNPEAEEKLAASPAGAGKRRSFSLTLVSLVASPLATLSDQHLVGEICR